MKPRTLDAESLELINSNLVLIYLIIGDFGVEQTSCFYLGGGGGRNVKGLSLHKIKFPVAHASFELEMDN